ncbi:expressed unknown protein [Seminavis robusta]|uniref:Uncharacterized protein n=1 Tax=Seminavis robusta TaxID=568900 RepID=A0A9N8DUN8_9STRA|nr:expressed unknown protein [Seminavis robusta]|eukprot:Sro385_g131670.1 n/a (121) ;mRNA; f:41184-41546
MGTLPYATRYEARVRLNSRERLNSRDLEQSLLGSIPEDEALQEPEESLLPVHVLPVVTEHCSHCGNHNCNANNNNRVPWYQEYVHDALFLMTVIIIAFVWALITLGWLVLLRRTTVVGSG